MSSSESDRDRVHKQIDALREAFNDHVSREQFEDASNIASEILTLSPALGSDALTEEELGGMCYVLSEHGDRTHYLAALRMRAQLSTLNEYDRADYVYDWCKELITAGDADRAIVHLEHVITAIPGDDTRVLALLGLYCRATKEAARSRVIDVAGLLRPATQAWGVEVDPQGDVDDQVLAALAMTRAANKRYSALVLAIHGARDRETMRGLLGDYLKTESVGFYRDLASDMLRKVERS